MATASTAAPHASCSSTTSASDVTVMCDSMSSSTSAIIKALYKEHAYESLVDLVRAHLELDDDDVDLDTHLTPCLEVMAKDKHWAESEFELRAIADAFGATVVKVSASPDVAHVRYEPSSMLGIGAVADQPVIHLVHYHGLHYRAGFANGDRAPYAPTPAARGVVTRQLPPRSTREKTAQQ